MLFGPIGIPQANYVWFRDRTGNSYGYAWLFLTSGNFARLGLLMQNGGVWNGQRLLSQAYISAASAASPLNGCYGFLFWTNRGDTCVAPTGFQFYRSWLPSAPRDLYAMAGSPQQKNFMIPSLNMTVSWMGVLTDGSPPADVWYKFFKTLLPGIIDAAPFVPGAYSLDPSGLNSTLGALTLSVLVSDVLSSPQCNIVFCNQYIPLSGLLQNIISILGLTANSLGAIFGA